MTRLFRLATLPLAALVLTSATPATPTPDGNVTYVSVPVVQELPGIPDVVDKFPDDAVSVVRVLNALNYQVNQRIEYVADIDQYGANDVWVQNPTSNKGDCEDYALTKLSEIQRRGFPIIAKARISMVTVSRPGFMPVGHAVLEVALPSGEIAVMDNAFDTLMKRDELAKDHGYRFQNW